MYPDGSFPLASIRLVETLSPICYTELIRTRRDRTMTLSDKIKKQVVNDYFTPNIKAEVILDTLLTPTLRSWSRMDMTGSKKICGSSLRRCLF